MLKNAKSNAELKGLGADSLVIENSGEQRTQDVQPHL
jgi:hypothetical protein